MGDSVQNSGAPATLLAPMAGITDLPFRLIAERYGAGVTTSEMVASSEAIGGGALARLKASLGLQAGRAAVQIAGREAASMAECARMAEGEGAVSIDINMGCPAKAVTGGYAGAALMRAPDLALEIIEAVIAAVSVPVTLKMRLGWEEGELVAPALAARAEAAGVSRFTVHGRARNQFYKGHADWRAVRAVKQAVRAPVIVNGDIVCVVSARRALSESGADGVMIGRGAQGRTWVIGEISSALAGRPFVAPSQVEARDLLIEQYQGMLALYGEKVGARAARKHLAWALERLPGAQALRHDIVRINAPAQVISRLRADWPMGCAT